MAKGMNKADLVDAVAKQCDCTKAAAGEAVDAVIQNITKSLKKGTPVSLVGFGTFNVSKRKARMGRNPQTNKEIKIPARKVPVFKPGKALKDAVK